MKKHLTILVLLILSTLFAVAAYGDPPTVAFPKPTPQMHSFSLICYVLDFVWPVWELLLLWVIMRSGLASRMRDRATSIAPWPWLVLPLFMVFYTVVVTVC